MTRSGSKPALQAASSSSNSGGGSSSIASELRHPRRGTCHFLPPLRQLSLHHGLPELRRALCCVDSNHRPQRQLPTAQSAQQMGARIAGAVSRAAGRSGHHSWRKTMTWRLCWR